MKVLVVVDMQKDFIDGSLGTKEAVLIVPKVVNKIKEFDGLVVATQDTHDRNYLATQEGKNLPVEHCIKDTEGWMLHPEVEKLIKTKPILKPGFGSEELADLLKTENEKEPIESITLIGICTDICVICNAMIIKAVLPEVPIIVDAKCCAGINPTSHNNALDAMAMCQIKIEK